MTGSSGHLAEMLRPERDENAAARREPRKCGEEF
jgi:hypothetical protein